MLRGEIEQIQWCILSALSDAAESTASRTSLTMFNLFAKPERMNICQVQIYGSIGRYPIEELLLNLQKIRLIDVHLYS